MLGCKKGKMGRPSKIKDINFEQVKKMASYGLTDKQMADCLDISEVTLNSYKNNPEFLKSLKEGKAISDEKVERSLFDRACGYEHPEEKVFCSEGCIVTHQTTKKYPPDPVAAIFWLKNRKPEQWRDKQEIDMNLKTFEHFKNEKEKFAK
jgi:hypothetical protein